MDKVIYKAEDIRKEIQEGIDFIVNPVASTIGPRGRNVFFETPGGDRFLTNDGVTIAKNLSTSNHIQDTFVEAIRQASLNTNSQGGDGTSSTIVLTGVLTKECLKLIDEGHSWIEIRDVINNMKTKLLERIEKNKILVDGKKGIKEVATISANNDKEIADIVVKAIDVAGQDGMIFLEGNNKPTTEIQEDLGFMIKSGVMFQELFVQPGKQTVVFQDVPVLLTDKKIYYAEEAETILRTALDAGYKEVVVVARDFMGEALNTFIANHNKDVVKVMLVRADVSDSGSEQLSDLAVYIGGTVVSEKVGSLVNKIKPEDFVVVTQAFSDPTKTLFTPKVATSKALKERIKMLREELEKDPENEDIKQRIASLTTGVVTLKVGGATPMEIRERVYRYEDAVHAVRSAMKHGYLVGGGLAMLRAFNDKDVPEEYVPLYRKYCEAIIRQIATNCGEHVDNVVANIRSNSGNYGYNALSGTFGDLLKQGVIDPFLVVKLAIENSVSVANAIISVQYYVLNEQKDAEESD